jgi:hypothetical protein
MGVVKAPVCNPRKKPGNSARLNERVASRLASPVKASLANARRSGGLDSARLPAFYVTAAWPGNTGFWERGEGVDGPAYGLYAVA